MRAIAERLGSLDPVYVQYGRFCQGDRGGCRLRLRAGHRALRRTLLRLLVPHRAGGLAAAHRPAAGHPVARARRRRAVAARRCRRPARLRAAPGHRLRPRGDGRRARGRLAADLLHRPAVAGALQLRAGLDRSGRQVHAVHRQPAGCGSSTCCCRGSRWPSSTRRCTPGSPAPPCWRPSARTTSAPPGPRACRSATWSSSTRCAPR